MKKLSVLLLMCSATAYAMDRKHTMDRNPEFYVSVKIGAQTVEVPVFDTTTIYDVKKSLEIRHKYDAEHARIAVKFRYLCLKSESSLLSNQEKVKDIMSKYNVIGLVVYKDGEWKGDSQDNDTMSLYSDSKKNQ